MTSTDPSPPPEPTSPGSIAKLAAALAAAQGEFTPIAKSRTVTVRSDKGNYTFDYAPLDEVLAATRPALARHGLALTQLVQGGGAADTRLQTILMHVSGERLDSEVVLPKTAGIQQLGSALTYLRRYSIVSILGVVAEEDDDGNAAEGNQSQRRGREAPRSPPATGARAAAAAMAKDAAPAEPPTLVQRLLFAESPAALKTLREEIAKLPRGSEARKEAIVAGKRRQEELEELAQRDATEAR